MLVHHECVHGNVLFYFAGVPMLFHLSCTSPLMIMQERVVAFYGFYDGISCLCCKFYILHVGLSFYCVPIYIVKL